MEISHFHFPIGNQNPLYGTWAASDGEQALGIDQSTTQVWVLADNTVATPTVAQLAQALKLAGQKQSELWIVPYQTETTEPTSN